MATSLVPQPPRLIRWYLEWSNARKMRAMRDMMRAELYWIRAQLMTASAVNKRISDANAELHEEVDTLKAELEQYTIVDPNEQCPACGHCGGTLKAIVNVDTHEVYVQHTCNVDGFQWRSAPVKANAAQVWLPTPGGDMPRGGILGL